MSPDCPAESGPSSFGFRSFFFVMVLLRISRASKSIGFLISHRWSLHIVVTSVDLFAHDRKVCLQCAQRIGLPGKPDRGHFDLGLQLTCGASTCEAEMPARIVIFHGLSSGFPNHLESHACGSGNGLQSRPARRDCHSYLTMESDKGRCRRSRSSVVGRALRTSQMESRKEAGPEHPISGCLSD